MLLQMIAQKGVLVLTAPWRVQILWLSVQRGPQLQQVSVQRMVQMLPVSGQMKGWPDQKQDQMLQQTLPVMHQRQTLVCLQLCLRLMLPPVWEQTDQRKRMV